MPLAVVRNRPAAAQVHWRRRIHRRGNDDRRHDHAEPHAAAPPATPPGVGLTGQRRNANGGKSGDRQQRAKSSISPHDP